MYVYIYIFSNIVINMNLLSFKLNIHKLLYKKYVMTIFHSGKEKYIITLL